jgi:hypothetical protein
MGKSKRPTRNKRVTNAGELAAQAIEAAMPVLVADSVPVAPVRGRPSELTQEVADCVCERLANGESLRSICRDEHTPGLTTVFRWLESSLPFREQYARAKQAGLEAMAEDILHIADTPMVGEKRMSKPLTVSDGEGNKIDTGLTIDEVTTADMIEHRRLQVETRKWLLTKLAPKKYGDRLAQEVSGPGGAPQEHTVAATLTPDEAYLRMIGR